MLYYCPRFGSHSCCVDMLVENRFVPVSLSDLPSFCITALDSVLTPVQCRYASRKYISACLSVLPSVRIAALFSVFPPLYLDIFKLSF